MKNHPTLVPNKGGIVISGMAKGIDSYAHTAALKENGYTIAVLAVKVTSKENEIVETQKQFSSVVHDGNCFFIRVLHWLYVVSKKIEEASIGENIE